MSNIDHPYIGCVDLGILTAMRLSASICQRTQSSSCCWRDLTIAMEVKPAYFCPLDAPEAG